MESRLPFHRRLGVQLGVAFTVVTVLALGATCWTLIRHEQDTLTRALTERVLDRAQSLSQAAAGPLLRHDPELGLHPFVLRALEDSRDIYDVQVIDKQGVVQGHRRLLEVGKPYQPSGQRRDLGLDVAAPDRAWLEGEDIVISEPVVHLGSQIGTVVVRASRAEIQAVVRDAQGRLFIVAGTGTLATVLAVVLLLMFNLRPLGALQTAVTRLGSGELSARVPVSTGNELGKLAELLNIMAEGLESAQTDMIRRERLDRELEIAQELQSMLLPRGVQPPTGYQVDAHYSPALEVSGDYFDLIPLSDGRLGLITADVSGKGVPGLVVMAMLRVILRGLAYSRPDPTDVLTAASAMLRGAMRKGMFVTCIYGILNTRTHRLVYTSAGHCPPATFGPNGVRWLPAGGKAIGMFPDPIFRTSLRTHSIQLKPGEGLLLYTDGLVEAMDPDGDQLGSELIHRRLLTHQYGDAKTVADDLLACVDDHRAGADPSDDLTMIVLRRELASLPAPEAVTT